MEEMLSRCVDLLYIFVKVQYVAKFLLGALGIFSACWGLFIIEGVSDLKSTVLMITKYKNLGQFFFSLGRS